MRYFDAHLHLPRADLEGVEKFLELIDAAPDCVGGCLILNTPAEVAVVKDHMHLIPSKVALIPYFDPQTRHPNELKKAGWYKLHPSLHKLDQESIPALVSALVLEQPRGIMVHSFPWGPDLRFNVSLTLVLQLAKALPESRILVSHGGGYESWAFRAHAGGFQNIHFDFSMSLDYYEGSDLLRPLQRYLRFSRTRVHFGSDWPSGNIARQVAELIRLSAEVGISESELEALLLENAATCWPETFGQKFNGNKACR